MLIQLRELTCTRNMCLEQLAYIQQTYDSVNSSYIDL